MLVENVDTWDVHDRGGMGGRFRLKAASVGSSKALCEWMVGIVYVERVQPSSSNWFAQLRVDDQSSGTKDPRPGAGILARAKGMRVTGR